MNFTRTMLASTAMGVAGVLVPGLLAAQPITGAGATFPAPVYAKWGEAAKAAIGIELNYQPIGSGGGQNQITNRTVDFGASDAPMDPERLKAANLLQFPMVMGAVVPIVNLPGVAANQLKLTGEILAEIYAGTITRWNDAKIAALNPGVTLPNVIVAPVFRADSSGTSFVFTSFLSEQSPAWKEKVGAGQSVKWPAGNGARGNDGVAATVKNTRGGLGYVENAYATQNSLVTTELKNRDGKFVAPSLAAFTAAAQSGDWANVANFAVDLIDQKGPDSWPIVSATFLLVPKDAKDPARTASVLKWVDWDYANGADIAKQLEYIALPKDVQDKVRATWHTQLTVDGKPVYK